MIRTCCCCLTIWICSTFPALGSDVPSSPPPARDESNDLFAPIEDLADLDAAVDLLRRAAWDLRAEDQPDPAGTLYGNLQSLVDQWLLTDSVIADLDRLRERAAVEAGEGRAADSSATIRQAAQLVDIERRRAGIINGTRFESMVIGAHEQAIAPWLAQVDERTRSAARARLDRARAELRASRLWVLESAGSELSVDALAESLGRSRDELTTDFNEERATLIAKVPRDAYSAVLDERWPLEWHRDALCPPGSTAASATEYATADFSSGVIVTYPEHAQIRALEGAVGLSVAVSETGCALRARIELSTGVQELDQAALEWAKGLRYRPGSLAGRPVESTARIATLFLLEPLPTSFNGEDDTLAALAGRWDELGPEHCVRPAEYSLTEDRRTMTIVRGVGPTESFRVVRIEPGRITVAPLEVDESSGEGEVRWQIRFIGRDRICSTVGTRADDLCHYPPARRCP